MKQTTEHIDNYSKKRNWEAVVQKYKSGYKIPDYIELPSEELPVKKIRLHMLGKIAAMLIFLVGISLFLKFIVFCPKQITISGAELFQNEPYVLKDGSMVYLNGKSEITFTNRFGTKNRELLLTGEAFFDVKRNNQIPFIIKTNNTITKVKGTQFNVYSVQSEKVQVSVVSGIVEFFTYKKENLVTLKAGEQGTYHPKSGIINKASIEGQNFQSWKTGILSFKETPLNEAFELLQRHYSRVFVFELNSEKMPRLTITIDNEPLASVLEELNLLLNTNSETRNDTIFFKRNH